MHADLLALQLALPGWTVSYDGFARQFRVAHPNHDRAEPGAGLSIAGTSPAEVLARVETLPAVLRGGS